MLKVTQLIGFGAGGIQQSFIGAITALGLDTNLVVCYDAGDIDCYADASNQNIVDLSAKAYDSWMGFDSGASNDPTFVGTIGALSGEHWDFDSASNERLVQKAVRAELRDFVDQGSQGSILLVAKADSLASARTLVATAGGLVATSNAGFILRLTTSGQLQWWASNAGFGGATKISTATISTDTWVVLGAVSDENGGASASSLYIDGTEETFDGNAGTGIDNADSMGAIGTEGDGGVPFDGQIGCIAIWDAKLTKANFDDMKTYLDGRYV